MSNEAAAFTLTALDTGTAGPVTFPGFPGVWHVGETKTSDELGLDPDEARRLVDELDLPLVEANGAAKKKATGAAGVKPVEDGE